MLPVSLLCTAKLGQDGAIRTFQLDLRVYGHIRRITRASSDAAAPNIFASVFGRSIFFHVCTRPFISPVSLISYVYVWSSCFQPDPVFLFLSPNYSRVANKLNRDSVVI